MASRIAPETHDPARPGRIRPWHCTCRGLRTVLRDLLRSVSGPPSHGGYRRATCRRSERGDGLDALPERRRAIRRGCTDRIAGPCGLRRDSPSLGRWPWAAVSTGGRADRAEVARCSRRRLGKARAGTHGCRGLEKSEHARAAPRQSGACATGGVPGVYGNRRRDRTMREKARENSILCGILAHASVALKAPDCSR